MTEEYELTSVGIDIGTSTTKFIVSKLRIARVDTGYSLPRVEIVGRQLEYASPIRTTPLHGEHEIDMAAISTWLQQEYARIGLRMETIHTGAVIITGETANKANAEQVVHALAERAGSFVVAIAGADMEGLLAGKGAGAELRSLHVPEVVANIDIGGGTANAAFFQTGKLLGTMTYHVGGRLIRLDAEGRVGGVSSTLKRWLTEKGYTLAKGDRVSMDQLEAIASDMCGDMLESLEGRDGHSSTPLLLAGSTPLSPLPKIGMLMISGGIGALMEANQEIDRLEQVAEYGDFGPLLAVALKRAVAKSPFRYVLADQTSRATVIGSGMQTVEVAGATVFLSPGTLPLRNLPVVPIEWAEADGAERNCQRASDALELANRLYAPAASGSEPWYAIVLEGPPITAYQQLQLLARTIVAAYEKQTPGDCPIVVVCRHDLAKALGQALYLNSGRRRKVVSIDQIAVESGDYLDIGEPVSGDLVPVVIKTLVFSQSGTKR